MAVDRRGRKDEERKTDYFDCVAFSGTAEFIHKYFDKGDGILVNGRMESNQWTDKDGNKRLSWALSVDDVEFPLGKKSVQSESYATSRVSESPMTNTPSTDNRYLAGQTYTSQGAPQAKFEDYEDDGDLPF